jgi:hypothetical protein
LAETWIAIEVLANGGAEDPVLVAFANDDACAAVCAFLEHGAASLVKWMRWNAASHAESIQVDDKGQAHSGRVHNARVA